MEKGERKIEARARDVRWNCGEPLPFASALNACYVCGYHLMEWRHSKKSGGYAYICATCHAGMEPD